MNVGELFSQNLPTPAISIYDRILIEVIIFHWNYNIVQIRDRWRADDPLETKKSDTHSLSHIYRSERWYMRVHSSLKEGCLFLQLLWLPTRGRGFYLILKSPKLQVSISLEDIEDFTLELKDSPWLSSISKFHKERTLTETFQMPSQDQEEAHTWSQAGLQM